MKLDILISFPDRVWEAFDVAAAGPCQRRAWVHQQGWRAAQRGPAQAPEELPWQLPCPRHARCPVDQPRHSAAAAAAAAAADLLSHSWAPVLQGAPAHLDARCCHLAHYGDVLPLEQHPCCLHCVHRWHPSARHLFLSLQRQMPPWSLTCRLSAPSAYPAGSS